jgi:hypothetical protein
MASVTRLQRRYDRQHKRLLRTKDRLNRAINDQATHGRVSHWEWLRGKLPWLR